MTEPTSSAPIKPPQARGQGASAVFVEAGERWGADAERVYVKRQVDYYCRPIWRGFRRTPTLRRELRGLKACRSLGVPVPKVVAYQERGDGAELVLEALPDSVPLDEALTAENADRAAIVANVATAIGLLHRGGWSHGALYHTHLLVGPPPDHPVTLIDLEKSRRSRRRQREDLDRFWRYSAGFLSDAEAHLFERCYRKARRHR